MHSDHEHKDLVYDDVDQQRRASPNLVCMPHPVMTQVCEGPASGTQHGCDRCVHAYGGQADAPAHMYQPGAHRHNTSEPGLAAAIADAEARLHI